MIAPITESQFIDYAIQIIDEGVPELPEISFEAIESGNFNFDSAKEGLYFFRILIQIIPKRHIPDLTDEEIDKILKQPQTLELGLELDQIAGKNPILFGTEIVNWIIHHKNSVQH